MFAILSVASKAHQPPVFSLAPKRQSDLKGLTPLNGVKAAGSCLEIFQTLRGRWAIFTGYIIDLWVIMDSGLVLADHYARTVPPAVRTAVAAFAVLNLTVVPTMTKSVLTSLWELFVVLPRQGLTSVAEGLARVPFLIGLTSAYAGVGTLGLQSFLEKYQIPTEGIKAIPAYIFPWVGYALRLSTVSQLMDISSGISASSKLEMFKSDGMQSLETLEDNKRLFRKVADAGFDETIETIRGRARSWILPVSWIGRLQAKHLAQKLQDRMITHVQNQVIGLAANTAAIMGMIVGTYLVAKAIFSIIQSVFFILQTYHRQTLIS